MSWVSRQLYMLIYIFAYMLDDFVVFGIALWGLDRLGSLNKYSRWSSLVGGLQMQDLLRRLGQFTLMADY